VAGIIRHVLAGPYDVHMPFSVDPTHPLDAPSRLSLVRAKVERAKQNLRDMEARLEEFYGEMRVSEKDSDPTHVFLNQPEPVRVTFDALCTASDIINNLRAALDHLIFQLIDVHSPQSPAEVFERCAFPICDDVTSYESAKRKKAKGISPEAMVLLDACKPYKGGNDALWELDELNNISKHRLILTVGHEVYCHAEWIGKVGFSEWFLYKFANPHFSGIYGPKMNQDAQLPGTKSITDPQIVECNALLPKLHQFVDIVDGLVKEFLPVLK
jgi:hypothetical protein